MPTPRPIIDARVGANVATSMKRATKSRSSPPSATPKPAVMSGRPAVEQRAEGDEQDDQRDEDTDALAARRLLAGEGEHLTAGADLQAVRAVGRLDQRR